MRRTRTVVQVSTAGDLEEIELCTVDVHYGEQVEKIQAKSACA